MLYERIHELHKREVESPSHQAILICFIKREDHETGEAWPSAGTVAWETGYSESHIKRGISELTEAGVLEFTGKWKSVGRYARTKIRTINLDQLEPKPDYIPKHEREETEPEVSITKPTTSDNGDEPSWEINQDRMQERNFERGIKWFVKSRGPHNFGCECGACEEARKAWKASEEGQAYMEEKRRWEELEQKASF